LDVEEATGKLTSSSGSISYSVDKVEGASERCP